MVSNREKIVRTLDDETKSINENVRDIAEQLDVTSWKSIRHMITAKRGGFNSTKDYRKHNFQKRGFKNYVKYLNYLARKRGFSHYRES